MAAKQSEPFVVVILGSTGTGKSKLAIEIAKQIGGEIISADSMQVYKGLDVITNKVTAEEQAVVPHHMIGLVEANEKFSVVEFQTMALSVVDDIVKRGKVPIVVGGTNYYIESILWKNLIETKAPCDSQMKSEEYHVNENAKLGHEIIQHERTHENTKDENPQHEPEEHDNAKHETKENDNAKHEGGGHVNAQHETKENDNVENETKENEHAKHEFNEHEEPEHKYLKREHPESVIDTKEVTKDGQFSGDELYLKLAKVDPVMAQKLHPNDTRKIARSLQVYEDSGKRHSELIAQQQTQEGASNYGGPMRFQNVCILWLNCDQETLDRRLDARVDKMMEQGLVDELLGFHNRWKTHFPDSLSQNTEGIFQSIGFKEFHEFLNSENPEQNSAVFAKCVESMKSATRRYARKQIKWVMNRFLGRPSTCSPDVYGLDTTDLEQWETCVLAKGLAIVKAMMAGEEVQEASMERQADGGGDSKHSRHVCEMCNNRTIIGDKSWGMHLRSRSHRHYKKKSKEIEVEFSRM